MSAIPPLASPAGLAGDPAALRGMTRRRVGPGRRDVFRMAGLSALGLALAACGVEGKKAAPPQQSDVEKYWSGKTKNGHVDFASWPLYMDPKLPELKQFTERTGITVNYKEVIQETGSWFAKIQPQLAANQSIGYDLMVITNGIQFTQLVQLGYLVPLDHSKLPNFAKNAGEAYKRQAFDPGNVYSIPYASGITGIAYNPKYVDEPPKSIADLWNPKYKGKVGMLADTQEIGNFGLLLIGVEPEKSTPADWERAAAKLREQRDSGIVRKYYEQNFIDPLGKGDIWLCQAWSGDIFQKNLSDGTDLRFVIPEEGGTIWTDNLVIPKTAANPVDAITLMDFFYEPEIAASLAEYINYITPVPAAQDVIRRHAAEAKGDRRKELEAIADSPLIFPSEEDYARLHSYRSFANAAEQKQYDTIFQAITTA
ncbi:ABC transporter substrate-binding protein [Thermopolyspora flexuosa]|jgi:spermidine/putrescine transport system substrate-binding protein|uniref:Spermidine/putrescine transport system substrate-binding protein n=1 Tax=Thermopolyspora flexuosa TaxID=103836 RepID=A0A543J110_9ACTN|nr:spermidine/putrescine ABC transporter substrate-binding protein [Thermopolyspora flexuosa]TQM76512.1 spermidine/putrescine transport system substrate-binding protein [Thermopolyspora flexuosa]GGM84820.1 ABC transporter substrate-binding protein [Thermopolyspora flexuosa]